MLLVVKCNASGGLLLNRACVAN